MARATDKRWKGYLIDWPTIAAMDSIDYELKPLNQQHVAILLMLLEYQKWETRWTNLAISKDELQVYIGDIEERLMRNEGGGMSAEEIRQGIYLAMNDLAAQLKSGVAGGFTVGEDGTVTFPSDATGDAALPEDDPATQIDESASAKSGGVSAVRVGFNLLWSDISGFYTGAVAVADAQTYMKSLYKWESDAAADTFVSFYYINRDAAHTFPASWASTLDGYLYCKGVNKATVNRWVLDTLATYPEQQSLNLVVAIAQAQMDEWFSRGLSTPSTIYKEYPCVPSPTEIMTLNVFNTNVSSQTSWKPNHRLKFTTTGVLTDTAAQHKRDFWYYDAAAAAPIFVPASMSMQLGTGITKPTINQVPFQAAGNYVFTIDTPASSGVLVLNMAAGGVFNSPFTGTITITIQDLGEILI
jgi:hypothetical protein